MATPNLGYLLTLPKFDYLEAQTIEEACSWLAKYKGKAKVIAGGTDLLVSMKKRELSPQYIINIKAIPDLDYIHYANGEGLSIGALTTLQSIADSPIIKDKFGLLATACNKVGTPQVRNMGTIGGNIGNGGPSQDAIPSLLVLEAKLRLVSLSRERIMPIQDFFIAPFRTALNEAELLTEIRIPPPPPHSAGSYHWLTKITIDDETLVGVAVVMTADSAGGLCQDIKIGLCSVAPTPIRAKQAEELLRGKRIEASLIEQVAKLAAEETSPRSRADYRKRMTTVLVKRAVNILPQAEVVAISGTSLINHTLENLLNLCHNSFVVIVGPSCPLSPVLFNYGVDVLAGAKVVEAEAVIEGISQGATLRQVKGIKLLAMKR